jgi:Fic family protein
LIESLNQKLTDDLIKEFHRILKFGTSDSTKKWFNVGDWKQLQNEVVGNVTTHPSNVEKEMNNLIMLYNSKTEICFNDIIEFHYYFEKIHPFQDGNGRVGRLIIFRECFKNNITPFIIDNEQKHFYYRGLREFENVKEYLLDTCLSAQDTYKEWVNYFYEGKI